MDKLCQTKPSQTYPFSTAQASLLLQTHTSVTRERSDKGLLSEESLSSISEKYISMAFLAEIVYEQRKRSIESKYSSQYLLVVELPSASTGSIPQPSNNPTCTENKNSKERKKVCNAEAHASADAMDVSDMGK
ncbi:hypothetical protein CEXT_28901 [Caerostris extrusa]|uniref:Uncharacterized protein n=1 Tax=Caerostris extrusa TaxID=172846 RepID=A0AAV4Y711_CAEEX|nr:hypothetical protein CEXT_28901 [Caerostris extrusa]